MIFQKKKGFSNETSVYKLRAMLAISEIRKIVLE